MRMIPFLLLAAACSGGTPPEPPTEPTAPEEAAVPAISSPGSRSLDGRRQGGAGKGVAQKTLLLTGFDGEK